MQQVQNLLKKIELLAKQEQPEAIDIDLMLDHTKAIYSLLLDEKNNIPVALPKVIDIVFEPDSILPAPVPETATQAEAPAIDEPIILHLDMPLTFSEEDEDEEEDEPEYIAEVATASDREEAAEDDNEIEDERKDVATEDPFVVSEPARYGDRDIRKEIGINDKCLYISELFHNDKDAYERALNEINRCTFCREATDWLSQQVKGRYNWDHENETVQQFYGVVSHFFASR
ncbi:MAG: hypothetical protein EOP56_16735 [Sphingobacteriales bacterium]|nr:MAG: hypothetical protein EOP56_16735 [Sphingobacteriales bacterium]